MQENTINISISKDFTKTPGARYKTDGPFSGEEFREKILEPIFSTNKIIIIDLDNTEGYATSFLEEAFGGLSRKYGTDACRKKLKFISDEDPLLIDEINEYLEI